MLRTLASKWAPNAFIISFKLETDMDLLLPKAKAGLEKYKHHISLLGVSSFYPCSLVPHLEYNYRRKHIFGHSVAFRQQ
ncbi:unnamed protein product [Allacma fusca]|uniref:Uncharacterized protein n=1 Tax=Allacma fusca TaxID=39272 RepID=A0A8J2P2C2_9HEXA|nr:unnamed protein product [Allacma fusca]